MRVVTLSLIGMSVGLAFSACGGGGRAAPTSTSASPVGTATRPALATVAGTAIPAVPPTATPAAAGATPNATSSARLDVRGGVPGGAASATIHTAPGVTCSIVYIHPSGKVSTARGLTSKITGPDGVASWTWAIDQTTKAGNGTVTVTCGTEKTSAPIAIGSTG